MDAINWREVNPVVVCGTGIDWRLMQRTGSEEFDIGGPPSAMANPGLACLGELRFVSLASLQPGKAYEAHAQESEEIYYIISGRGRMVIDGESRQIRDGDCICTHAGQVHQIINDGEETIQFLAFE